MPHQWCKFRHRHSAEKIARMVDVHPQIRGGVGIHPWEEELGQSLAEGAYSRLKELAANPRIVCISEVGLDYARSPHSRETQMERQRAASFSRRWQQTLRVLA